MKITETQEIAVVVSKECDICHKTLDTTYYTDMIEIEYKGGAWQGFKQDVGSLDVCSTECFLQALNMLKKTQMSITKVNNGRFFLPFKENFNGECS